MIRSLILSIVVFPVLIGLAACDKKEPAAQTKPAGTQTAAAPAEAVDWCAEHGVPESVCTKCNKKLIAEFKKKGDWCKEHDLPESHCTICNPDVKEKFLALKPKEGK